LVRIITNEKGHRKERGDFQLAAERKGLDSDCGLEKGWQ